MVWVICAAMSLAAVLSVLWPLWQRRSRRSRAEADLAFYRMQLAEVDRDAATGLVPANEIEAARIEVARRLLAADAETNTPAVKEAAEPRGRRLAAAVLALVAIPSLSIGLYGWLGSPNEPDKPLAARLAAPPNQTDPAVAIARIDAYLAAHPDDGPVNDMVAPVYLRTGRAEDAVKAYSRALALLGDTPERREGYGMALVAAAGGKVTAQAKAAFEAAHAAAPSRPASRLYLALAAEQAGDKPGAIDMLSKLVADMPDAPWVPMLRDRIASLGGTPPAADAAAAIAALPPGAQQVAIRGMVDGLAARLARDGRDPEGWLKLVRAYVVLKEEDKARRALADGRRSLADDAPALSRLEALGRELGLGGS